MKLLNSTIVAQMLKSTGLVSMVSTLVIVPILMTPNLVSAESTIAQLSQGCIFGSCRSDDDNIYRDRGDDNDRYDSRLEDEINNIYREVLGRNADRRGLRDYSRQVQRSGWSLREVRRDIAKSREAEDRINDIYRSVLGRNADRDGLKTYTNRLAEGWTLRQVRRDIGNSREARNRRDRDYNGRRDRTDDNNRRRDRNDDNNRRQDDNVPVYRSPDDVNRQTSPVLTSPNDL
ncbi:MAG: DUF4214 domain-containing protein [Scytolyngbya sp. HA4215-MV1]|nr:DUF4214 domain-containing protein [Scytolyngbya sp. HA4215-MV1]